MKKIFLTFAMAAVALGFSSCNETWDDNPVLNTHEGEITADFLNIPAMQNQSIMITNSNKDGHFNLTCSQPDFGYAAVATYKVQVSLTEDFTEFEEIAQAFYDCAQINPLNGDVAAVVEKLSGVKTEDDLPLPYQKVYMRLHAYVAQSASNTNYISNVVHFNSVSADYLAIWVADVPVNIYVRGGMNDWGSPAEWQFKTGTEENTWVIDNCTIAAGTEFKIAASIWETLNLGAGSNGNIVPGESFALDGGDNPGNITMTEDFTGKVVLTLEAGNYSVVFDPVK
ncbi:MAG: SusE domain-containing protein [Muribaculaceae bacterium]|nr:SusE domain-containing protein [Muribaculaceae bacterium]